MSFRGRLAIVTGGASGIVCCSLAAEGVTVVVADRQLEAARQVAQSLPGKLKECIFVGCLDAGDAKHRAMYVDAGDTSSVEQLFNCTRTSCPQPLSIVVNCAGIYYSALLEDTTDEIFDDVIRVNLKGTFLINRAAAREILRSGKALPEIGAAIVNVASISAKGGASGCSAYAASKAGVVALTKSLAQELASHGIRCHAVLPGWTDTPMTNVLTKRQRNLLVSLTPLKCAAQPREIAEAIKFLCSPTASSFVTGAELEVTGGFKM
ncbi:estradiol 17-beta-dehydrogenase 8 [Rhipicephalus sanguineus]|uniref:estradiol 17-beta-dehydrogenase 8 n=1 Tax=Rhipicephalus sanguineus TaxID=34632 RepID=UPI0020C31135|nr:estradiol 17-beta-dehydrogenase 8 [Rhipicephalus sanguineus]